VRPFWGAVAGALLALPLCTAADSGSSRTVVIVCEGLRLEDLRDPRLPALRALASDSAVGLLNTASGRGADRVARMVALATGTREGAEASDAWVLLAGEPAEGTSAGVVLRRRSGADWRESLARSGVATKSALVHLGIGSLARRRTLSLTPASAAAREHRPAPMVVAGDAPAGSPGRAAAMLAMAEDGVAPALLWAREMDRRRDDARVGARIGDALAAHSGSAVVVVGAELPRARALARLEGCLGALAAPSARTTRVLLVAPTPPTPDRLSVAVLRDGGGAGLMTSATTRTEGLAAIVDVAPSLRAWLDLPPSGHAAGHPLQRAPHSRPDLALAWLDAKVASNAEALEPVFVVLGALAAVVGFGVLAALLRGRSPGVAGAWALLWLVQTPLALLLVAPLPGGPPAVVLAEVVGWMALLAAFVGWVAARGARLAPVQVRAGLCWSAALLAGALAVDAVTGQRLTKFSLLSSYQLQGIRFYGIGNEYAGCLIGLALLWAFLARMRVRRAAVLVTTVAVVLGWPSFGANAGGAAAAVAGGVTALWALGGRRVGWRAASAAALAGVASATALAVADAALAARGASATHLGDAVTAYREGGMGALVAIASRKVLMNAQIAIAPGALVATGGVVIFGLLASRTGRPLLERLVRAEPEWGRALPVAAVASAAALAFNDSGVVPALFVCGAVLVPGLALACVLGEDRRTTVEPPDAPEAPA